jgi:biotin carboxyl carrier protein
MAEKYLVRFEDEEVTLELERGDDGFRVRREGSEDWRSARLERIGGSSLHVVMLDHHPIEIYLERRRGGAVATIGRHTFNFDVGPWRPQSARVGRKGAAAGGAVRITAPMTGSIVEVQCRAGERVQAGQVLLVIESMKMNNELRSRIDGTVESVPVAPGQRVNAGDLLVALQADGAS